MRMHHMLPRIDSLRRGVLKFQFVDEQANPLNFIVRQRHRTDAVNEQLMAEPIKGWPHVRQTNRN